MATLAEKLQLTLDCKNEIKTVMNEKLGLEVTDSTPLSEYATMLSTVKVGSGDSGSTKIPSFVISIWATGTGFGDSTTGGSLDGMKMNVKITEKNTKFKIYVADNLQGENLVPFCGEGAKVYIVYQDLKGYKKTGSVDLNNTNEFILDDCDLHYSTSIYTDLIKWNDIYIEGINVVFESTSEDATVTVADS